MWTLDATIMAFSQWATTNAIFLEPRLCLNIVRVIVHAQIGWVVEDEEWGDFWDAGGIWGTARPGGTLPRLETASTLAPPVGGAAAVTAAVLQAVVPEAAPAALCARSCSMTRWRLHQAWGRRGRVGAPRMPQALEYNPNTFTS